MDPVDDELAVEMLRLLECEDPLERDLKYL